MLYLSGHSDWADGWGCFPGRSSGSRLLCSIGKQLESAQPMGEPSRLKHRNKPELKKLYLHHCLRKSYSCLRHVFLLLVLLEGSGLGDRRGWGCQFPSAVRSGPGGSLPS